MTLVLEESEDVSLELLTTILASVKRDNEVNYYLIYRLFCRAICKIVCLFTFAMCFMMFQLLQFPPLYLQLF